MSTLRQDHQHPPVVLPILSRQPQLLRWAQQFPRHLEEFGLLLLQVVPHLMHQLAGFGAPGLSSGIERLKVFYQFVHVMVFGQRVTCAVQAHVVHQDRHVEISLALVERIEVGTKRLQVTIRAQALGCNESFELDLPVELKRRGMAMRLIVRSEAANGSPRVDAKLVAVIAKAQQWFGMLASGQAAGVGEIASAHQVGSSYVTRVIYLAFLAPNIIERIASGRAPVELSAERLTRMVPLPADWAAQRELLGMA